MFFSKNLTAIRHEQNSVGKHKHSTSIHVLGLESMLRPQCGDKKSTRNLAFCGMDEKQKQMKTSHNILLLPNN